MPMRSATAVSVLVAAAAVLLACHCALAAAQTTCEGFPPLPENAVAGNCTNGTQAGTVCTAACADGFTQYGDAEYLCAVDGQYYGGCGFECTKWQENFDHLYLFSKDFGLANEPFAAAQAICESFDSNLTSIHTKAENEYVFQLIGGSNRQAAWIGTQKDLTGRDITPFDWYNTDGTPFDIYDAYPDCTEGQGTAFQDCLWFFGDPNNLNGNEECVQMGQRDADPTPVVWNDADCVRSKRSYV